MPRNTDSSRSWDSDHHTPSVFGIKSTYSNGSSFNGATPLRQALIDLAKGSPATHDLAAVLVMDSAKAAPTKDTLQSLAEMKVTWQDPSHTHIPGVTPSRSLYKYQPAVLDGIEHAAKKMGVYDQSMRSLGLNGVRWPGMGDGSMTIGEWVAKQRENRDGERLV